MYKNVHFWSFARNLKGFLLKYFFVKYLIYAKIDSLSTGATHEFLKSINQLLLSNFSSLIFSFFIKVIFFHIDFDFGRMQNDFDKNLEQRCLAQILDHSDKKMISNRLAFDHPRRAGQYVTFD